MNTNSFLILIAIAAQLIAPTCGRAETSFRPFVLKDYPSEQFNISSNEIKHGTLKIRITQAKKIANASQSPYACRAWIEVEKTDKMIFSKYFDDIDPAAFSYGIFVPKSQPKQPYLAVVKNGDYDGKLFLIRNDGKVNVLLGGFYFFTKDKRYLFSDYASDSGGLAVFDLDNRKVVFSSDRLPYIHQWYEKDGTYFFTESEWRNNSGEATEKAGIIHSYDFSKHKIIEKKVNASYLKRARKIIFDFDPRKYSDCTNASN